MIILKTFYFTPYCRDFNARIGIRNGTWNSEVLNDMCCDKDSDTEPFPRRSNDIQVITFGRQLIDVCDMYECMILNELIDCGFD